MIVQAPFQVALQSVKGARLVLTDPPYNLGFDYGKVADDMDDNEYAGLIQDFVVAAFDASVDDAHLMVIHYPEHFAEFWPLYTQNGWRFHDWLAWTYSGHTPEPDTSRLRRAHRVVLWLQKGNPQTFADRIQRPYRNPKDRRIRARVKRGLTGARATDVFHVEQVKMGSKEHLGYSNQIPQALLRPLVLLTTEPGELVVDPFAGTGSTLRAAIALGRQAWGCDANPEAQRFWGDLEITQAVLPAGNP